MREIHDNFEGLSTIALELQFAVRNDEELNNLSSCVTIACCQTSIKSYFHGRKKQRWIQEPCHN